MRGVNPTVDDGHDDAFAGRDLPGIPDIKRTELPLLTTPFIRPGHSGRARTGERRRQPQSKDTAGGAGKEGGRVAPFLALFPRICQASSRTMPKGGPGTHHRVAPPPPCVPPSPTTPA